MHYQALGGTRHRAGHSLTHSPLNLMTSQNQENKQRLQERTESAKVPPAGLRQGVALGPGCLPGGGNPQPTTPPC